MWCLPLPDLLAYFLSFFSLSSLLPLSKECVCLFSPFFLLLSLFLFLSVFLTLFLSVYPSLTLSRFPFPFSLPLSPSMHRSLLCWGRIKPKQETLNLCWLCSGLILFWEARSYRLDHANIPDPKTYHLAGGHHSPPYPDMVPAEGGAVFLPHVYHVERHARVCIRGLCGGGGISLSLSFLIWHHFTFLSLSEVAGWLSLVVLFVVRLT